MFNEKMLESAKKLHFIGIGGSGMFPIVQILESQGYEITGSDNNESDTLELVRKMGIPVFLGHDAENINGADMIIYSAAISPENPERTEALKLGIPAVERSDVLGYITRRYKNSICISGTHGKTSTTAMLTHVLVSAGLDPTAVIGGKLPLIGGYGRAGKSDIMTCEACEFVDTFLKLSSDISVILNVDADHLDYFKTLDNVIASFRKFAENTSRVVIVNGDDKNAMKAVDKIAGKKIVTFGFSDKNDYYPENIRRSGPAGSAFDLMCRGEKLTELEIGIPGIHNVSNAVAAFIAALEAGLTPEMMSKHFPGFSGAGRRFEVLGKRGGVTVVDDYAHHPLEIEATLKVAKAMGYNAVWAVFQPFTYSRTKLLLEQFADALKIADRVVMSEIMGGREKNTYNIHTCDLAELIPGSVWFPGFPEIAKYVMENASKGDLVITLGCGDIYKCAKMMLQDK